jgi:hypothetical protein
MRSRKKQAFEGLNAVLSGYQKARDEETRSTLKKKAEEAASLYLKMEVINSKDHQEYLEKFSDDGE